MKKMFAWVCCLPVVVLLGACTNSAGNTAKGDGAAADAGGVSGSGSDYYYQSAIKGGGKMLSMNGTMKMYLSGGGKVRMEMLMGIDTNGVSTKKDPAMVLLGNSADPRVSISLDAEKKTYAKNHIDTADSGDGMKTESTVEKVADETILGFHCVHARVISAKSIGSAFKMIDTLDIWRSEDVPMQADFRKWLEQFESRSMHGMYSSDVGNKLKQMGCDGFFVKMTVHGKDTNVTTELTKVERRDLPANLFDIPAGYTEDKSGGL